MTFFIIAILLVILDQASKFLVHSTLVSGGTLVLIPGWVDITYVENPGAAFSMFPNATMVLASISLAVTILLILAIALRWLRHPFGRFSLMLLLAGAVGNLIDRVALGCVTDMIKVEFIPFFQLPVFNIADILVVLGGILLVIYVLFCWNRCERVYGKREMRKGRRQNSK